MMGFCHTLRRKPGTAFKCFKQKTGCFPDSVVNVSLGFFRTNISEGTFMCLLERCQINGDHAAFIYNQCLKL